MKAQIRELYMLMDVFEGLYYDLKPSTVWMNERNLKFSFPANIS